MKTFNEMETQKLPYVQARIQRKKVEVETVWLPRPAAKYPGCYPVGFENIIVRELGTDKFAHLFAGMSKSGFRVDTNKEVKPDFVGNCEDLSGLKDGSFPGVVADPPYTEEFAQKLYGQPLAQWGKWTKEAVRICAGGGKIAIMHNYVVPRLPGCEYVKILVIITRIKQYPKIVTLQRKK